MKTTPRLAVLSSATLLALAGAFAIAGCGTDSPAGSSSGDPDAGGPAADAGSEAAACATDGAGTIALVVSGLPDGVAGKVTITGPSGTPSEATGSTTLADQAAGTYAITADRVAKADPIVRTLYQPTVSTSSVCLAGAATETVTVTYAEIPSSHKLWTANSNNASGQILAFAGADLGATGSPAAKVAMKGVVGAHGGGSVAFDKDGNLWALGATTTDSPLLRFAAADLGASGEKTPDRKIAPKLSGCTPGLSSIAFDPSGALWATVLCADQILRVSPESLATSQEYTPAAGDFATGTEAPRAVAFDKDGNMWVSGAETLHRYSAASLAPGQPHVPDLAIQVKTAGDAKLPPDALAFDAAGNLWMMSFGGNAIAKLTPADLAPSSPTKDVVPSVIVSISVGALLEGMAFDEGGGMWLTYSQGKIARLAPTQLETSTTPGDPTIPETIVTSADIGSAGGMALFPAPSGLPIYGRF